jgi:hypothetical protein
MPAHTPSGSRRSIDVWSSRYSPAACVLIVRAAPAKNRRLSTVRSNSNSMMDAGLPTFSISRRLELVQVVLDGIGQRQQLLGALARVVRLQETKRVGGGLDRGVDIVGAARRHLGDAARPWPG